MIIHGYSRTPTYRCHTAMLQRCYNRNHPHYSHYGARGIKVCQPWHNFQAFLNDMGVRPAGLTLDRINNNKGYSKANCRWTSRSFQDQNRRKAINCSSRYRGVSWDRASQNWRAQIMKDYERTCLGRYDDEKEAAHAYDLAAIVLYGPEAARNFQ